MYCVAYEMKQTDKYDFPFKCPFYALRTEIYIAASQSAADDVHVYVCNVSFVLTNQN
jgi:hypothetical protein